MNGQNNSAKWRRTSAVRGIAHEIMTGPDRVEDFAIWLAPQARKSRGADSAQVALGDKPSPSEA
jgi:hypothetical protein